MFETLHQIMCVCLNVCVFACPFQLLKESTNFYEILYNMPLQYPKLRLFLFPTIGNNNLSHLCNV